MSIFALDVLHLDIGREQELRARAYAATHESACYWWPGRTHVIVSERPSALRFDRPPKPGERRQLIEARWDWVDGDGKKCEWVVRP